MVNEDVKIAWITITFLDNRRVLFVVGRTEIPRYYIKTVYEIPESVKLIFSKARKTHSYCVYRMFLSKIAIHLSGECIAW